MHLYVYSLIPCGTHNVLRCRDLGTEIRRKIQIQIVQNNAARCFSGCQKERFQYHNPRWPGMVPSIHTQKKALKYLDSYFIYKMAMIIGWLRTFIFGQAQLNVPVSIKLKTLYRNVIWVILLSQIRHLNIEWYILKKYCLN